MLNISNLKGRIADASYLAIALATATAMVLGVMMPILLQGRASAATLLNRSVTLASSAPGASGAANTYTFAFETNASFTIQSIIFEFCDVPIPSASPCTLPGDSPGNEAVDDNTEIDVAAATAALPANHFTGTTNNGFTEVNSDTGNCTDADRASQITTMYCVTRTQGTPEAADVKTFTIESIRNPNIIAGNNEEIYVRISLYSDTAFATLTDNGTVAAAVVNQLTVTGRVQERLVFCVFALEDAAGSNTTVGTGAGEFPDSCAATEATASSTVDIGVVDNLSVARSPRDAGGTTLGNDRFGAAMINTNAGDGVTLTYYATAAGTGTNELRAFRQVGSTCNASQPDFTDPCFRSAPDNTNAGTTITAGNEYFGMQIVCVTNSNTTTAGTTANLGTAGNGTGTAGSFRTAYANGDTTLTGGTGIQDDGDDDCETDAGEGDLYAWQDSATAQAIISSTNVVDDEVVKLRFGSSAAATTPTGLYTVASTFIATPQF